MDGKATKKEIIIKRVSAFKFEIEVASEEQNEGQVSIKRSEMNAEAATVEPVEKVERISVIRRAPPSSSPPPALLPPELHPREPPVRPHETPLRPHELTVRPSQPPLRPHESPLPPREPSTRLPEPPVHPHKVPVRFSNPPVRRRESPVRLHELPLRLRAPPLRLQEQPVRLREAPVHLREFLARPRERLVPSREPSTPPTHPKLPSYQDYVTRERTVVPVGAVLIRDAIMYRIVEILLWKVLGERQLRVCGYPTAPTYKVLWGTIYHSYLETGPRKLTHYPQDHDCGGNMACFLEHVSRFLERCAPTPELWKKFGWSHLSLESILRKIYYEDLVPFLRDADLRNNVNILHSHADIVLLEKWQAQGFTAISWNGQKHFAQLEPEEIAGRCGQCSQEPLSQPGNVLWHKSHRHRKEYSS